jgi:hypothetical protein
VNLVDLLPTYISGLLWFILPAYVNCYLSITVKNRYGGNRDKEEGNNGEKGVNGG